MTSGGKKDYGMGDRPDMTSLLSVLGVYNLRVCEEGINKKITKETGNSETLEIGLSAAALMQMGDSTRSESKGD